MNFSITFKIKEVSLDELGFCFEESEKKYKKTNDYYDYDYDDNDGFGWNGYDDFWFGDEDDDFFNLKDEPKEEEFEELENFNDDDFFDYFWWNISFTEDWEEIAFDLQKERWLAKLPKDRNEDKRRVWKWIQKFIDTEVPEEMLIWMPPKIQELMKKWKINWKILQDEIMSANSKFWRRYSSFWWNFIEIYATWNRNCRQSRQRKFIEIR